MFQNVFVVVRDEIRRIASRNICCYPFGRFLPSGLLSKIRKMGLISVLPAVCMRVNRDMLL